MRQSLSAGFLGLIRLMQLTKPLWFHGCLIGHLIFPVLKFKSLSYLSLRWLFQQRVSYKINGPKKETGGGLKEALCNSLQEKALLKSKVLLILTEWKSTPLCLHPPFCFHLPTWFVGTRIQVSTHSLCKKTWALQTANFWHTVEGIHVGIAFCLGWTDVLAIPRNCFQSLQEPMGCL